MIYDVSVFRNIAGNAYDPSKIFIFGITTPGDIALGAWKQTMPHDHQIEPSADLTDWNQRIAICFGLTAQALTLGGQGMPDVVLWYDGPIEKRTSPPVSDGTGTGDTNSPIQNGVPPVPGARYGSGSSKPPTDSPRSGKPNFVAKSIRLTDPSGAERYVFKKTDTIRMVGKFSNNGSANIPSDKDVNSMFLLSKGYNEDPHGDWQQVGKDETRSGNIETGDTQEEEETLKLWERNDIVPGRVYNIVFCTDRKQRDNNNGGEFEEVHESDNCTTEAAFEVEGTYNFLLNLPALSNNQPNQGETFSYTIGIGNTLDQPNEDVAVALYISPNQDWNGRWLVESFTIPASSLPTGGSFWRNGTLIAPSSGDYTLWACVNPSGTIPETTGSDNCKSQWFKVKSELNFSLSNLTLPKQSFTPGERMTVTATSLVTGDSSTQGVDLSFFITPNTWENRQGIDVAMLPPLQNGAPFTENYAITAPQAGGYRLYVCINASGMTPEPNGNDNCQSVWFESKNSDIPNPPPSQTEEEEEFEAMQAWMLLMF